MTDHKIHFIDINGDTYCGNTLSPSDETVRLPRGSKPQEYIIQDHLLCAICWCVWLSVMVEEEKKNINVL